MHIALKSQAGPHPAGSVHPVISVIPHGGYTDEDRQYVIEGGVHVLPSNVEIVEDWDFWSDIIGAHCVGYNSQIDEDALNVLKGIAAKKFNSVIAAELGLPEQYVELLQSLFCSAGWADYGTSPRGCWIDHRRDAEKLVSEFEKYVDRKWHQDDD